MHPTGTWPALSRFCEGGRTSSCFFPLEGCPQEVLNDISCGQPASKYALARIQMCGWPPALRHTYLGTRVARWPLRGGELVRSMSPPTTGGAARTMAHILPRPLSSTKTSGPKRHAHLHLTARPRPLAPARLPVTIPRLRRLAVLPASCRPPSGGPRRRHALSHTLPPPQPQ